MKAEIQRYIESVKKKPAREAKAEQDRPISTIKAPAGGSGSHSVVPGASPGWNVEEERRMWQVWQDHQRTVDQDGTSLPGLRGRSSARRPRPRKKGDTAPAFYEKVLEQERKLELQRHRKRNNPLARLLPWAGVFLAALVVGALLLPYFPFLWRIPVLGNLMMQLRNLIIPQYRG